MFELNADKMFEDDILKFNYVYFHNFTLKLVSNN